MSSERILSNTVTLGAGGPGAGARIVEVTVDRPAKLNALNPALAKALAQAFRALERTDARAVVLSGAGERAFIGGADVVSLKTLEPSTARAFITSVHHICEAIRRCPVPVIARINGYCLGAGLEIAAACDIRIAEPDAVLGMPEVRVGLPSVVEAALLPRLIGWGHTRWMLLTGETIDARRGADWGLVDVLADPGGLDAATDATARSVASAAPHALRVQKALLADWEKLSLGDSIAAGIDAFVGCYEAGSEPADYVAAFLSARHGTPDPGA